MTLESTGTAGRVSEYISSDRIADGQPVDRVHVTVYRMPGDDDHPDLDEGDRAHDVVLRESKDEDGNRPVVESWGSFPNAEEACVHALDLAETHDCVVGDEIIELR